MQEEKTGSNLNLFENSIYVDGRNDILFELNKFRHFRVDWDMHCKILSFYTTLTADQL